MNIADTENNDMIPVNPTLIGVRLREIRQARNLTLKQVAEATGFALSFLSLLERDKVSINVDNLARMAHFYGVRMVSLFENESSDPIQLYDAAMLAKKAEGVGPGGVAFTLLSDRRSRLLEPLYIVIGPGGGDPEFRTYEGESLLVVQEGAVTILDMMGERTTISSGCIAFYEGRTPRRIMNASETSRAIIIVATSPPNDRRDRVVDMDQHIIIQAEDK